MSLFQSLFGKKVIYENPIIVDIHSHFIPGIDDGVATESESLDLITGLYHLGYKKLITTPHIFHGVYNNSYDSILPGLDRMRKLIQQSGMKIELEASAEYFFDEYFLRNIQNETLLPFGDNYVLFELPSSSKPPQVEDAVFELTLKGYKPVLAHPERYPFYNEPGFSSLEKLKSMGVLFQVNALSLSGFYSPKVQRFAKQLIKQNWIDWVGSDMHNHRYFDNFKIAIQTEAYHQLCTSGNLLNNTLITH